VRRNFATLAAMVVIAVAMLMRMFMGRGGSAMLCLAQ
jgi:hypothetical protein